MTDLRTSLAKAIDIPAWLEQDRQLEWQTRTQRDQQIASQADIPTGQETQRVLRWWSTIQTQQKENSPGQVLTALFRRVSWVAVLIGFFAGIALAGTLLHYDGTQPINVLVLLIVLVIIPLLLFLLSLLVPLFSSNSLVGSLNIGNQVLSFLQRKSSVLQEFFSSSRSDQTRDTFLRWKLLVYSQQFGIALAIAALLTLLAKVSFSDLAFGWSTTLNLESSRLTPWIHALALPWSSWLPQAVPTSELIEQSRYFRLEDAERNLSAAALTGWWKFIAMCLLVYGIGFRVLAAWFASMNCKRAITEMLMQHSEVTGLLDRFNAPSNLHDEAPVVTADHAEQNLAGFNHQAADMLIRWNRAAPVSIVLQHENIVDISSENVLELDEKFKDINDKDCKHIHIFTKAWEPPLLEFHDLVLALRNKFGAQTSISVQPVSPDTQAPGKVDVEIWRHSLEKLQDAKVYVV